jgi:cyclic pyranopterin phosphate synthase
MGAFGYRLGALATRVAGLAAGVAAFLAATPVAAAFTAAATFAATALGATALGATTFGAALAAFLFPIGHCCLLLWVPDARRFERSDFIARSASRRNLARLAPVEPLVDSWGREIGSVRVSVTDKCNFRCRYCMPAEGLEWLGREEILSFEEIARLAGLLARMGVSEVRLTGGEPLVRRDVTTLVGMLARIPGVDDLSLTTNGVLLDRLAGPLVEAGLQRLNVSLDSLSHVRFAEITRRDALDRVLEGLAEAERYPELRPIKVNCVAIRSFTEEEVPALAELARRKPYVVRFIEFMPLDADEAWREDDVLTGAEIRALIEERWPLVEVPAKASSTARRFRFADGAGEIGFVNPVSEPFCSSCDRIRLTADGKLRTCLFSRREWDLKTPLREGASDAEVARLIRFAVRHKELKHKINEPGFVRASRSMSQIGG